MASLTINSKSASEAPKNIIKSAKTVSDLKEMYSVGKIIGNGGSSVVRIVKNKKSDTLRAMKIIDKRYIEDKSRLELEVSIQLNLSHPSIVKLYDGSFCVVPSANRQLCRSRRSKTTIAPVPESEMNAICRSMSTTMSLRNELLCDALVSGKA